MRAKLFWSIMIAASCVALTGCGGGGGGSSLPAGTLAASSDGKVTIKGQAAAVPEGVSLDVQSRAAVDLPNRPQGSAFVAAADCEPAGTTFSQAVSLVFTLATALDAGTEVRLYEYNASSQWVDTGIRAVLSADGLTATVSLTQLNSNAAGPYYMLLCAP